MKLIYWFIGCYIEIRNTYWDWFNVVTGKTSPSNLFVFQSIPMGTKTLISWGAKKLGVTLDPYN